MAKQRVVTTRVNGEEVSFLCEPRQSLLECLRDVLGLTGTKMGCNDGNCGACAVLLDGDLVNSCLVLGVEVEGREVTTVEGLGRSTLHALQEAFVAAEAAERRAGHGIGREDGSDIDRQVDCAFRARTGRKPESAQLAPSHCGENAMTKGQLALLLILVIATGWTGLKVVQAQHLSRQLFAERERLRVEADELTVTWGQLQVELATFADYGRVEKLARKKLDMRAPRMDEMQVLR